MEYAFLKFNDDLKIKIKGLGLVPAICLYPELWKLYLKKLELHADYLDEIIKAIKNKKNRADALEEELSKMNKDIEKEVLFLGLSPLIAVSKMGEEKNDTIVRNLITNEVFYIDSEIFKKNVTNEFEAKVYTKGRNL